MFWEISENSLENVCVRFLFLWTDMNNSLEFFETFQNVDIYSTPWRQLLLIVLVNKYSTCNWNRVKSVLMVAHLSLSVFFTGYSPVKRILHLRNNIVIFLKFWILKIWRYKTSIWSDVLTPFNYFPVFAFSGIS